MTNNLGRDMIDRERKRQSRQPSKALKAKVREAFDADQLKRICEMDQWAFYQYAQRHDLEDGRHGTQRFFYHQDNGSNILAIAHLDSVQEDGTCAIVDTSAGLLACSGALDDRLGAYVILELLPKLGIVCDVLLTTDEEICDSTAQAFDTDKRYNWLFQFDRGGTDVVMYDYETPDLINLVERSGAQVGVGSFSDICCLEHLGCAGFNWGVGYRDYHGPRAHAWLEDTFRMVARFAKFHAANAATPLAHYPRWGKTPDDDDGYAEWWAKQDIIVADCGHEIDLEDERSYIEQGGGIVVCADCGTMP